MAEKATDGFGINWATLLTLLLASGSAVLFFRTLNSSRPTAGDERPLENLGFEDVEARLWQDPLRAAVAHHDRAESTTRESISHDPATLRREIESKAREGDGLLVLPVMIPGDRYAEQAESRLRARKAVLEALATAGYAPEDDRHIGYVDLAWYWPKLPPRKPGVGPPQPFIGYGGDGSRTVGLSDAVTHLTVPYEWCTVPSVAMAGGAGPKGGPPYDRVLVLWLRDEAFADRPMTRLAYALAALGADRVTVRAIGPRSSTGLRALVNEAGEGIGGAVAEGLRSTEFIFAAATASDGALLAGGRGRPAAPAGARPGDDLASYVRRRTGVRVRRMIAADDRLVDELVRELERRQVVTAPYGEIDSRNGLDGEARTLTGDHIAIVSEWDTFYGRALPMTFAARAAGVPLGRLAANPGLMPSWVHFKVYLRGIDGRVPGSGEEKGKSSKSGADQEKKREADKEAAPDEAPEGLNQADYIRRLAADLDALNDQLVREHGTGLRAIGLLGTDVYDKLVLLRALRDRFPSAVFFTTDLDARYAHPAEYPWARNLVIASGYGYGLHPYYQRGVPPFRDVYQTAAFAAVLSALGQVGGREMGRPRIFEIGKRGAFDLSPDAAAVELGRPGELAARPATVQPPRRDLRSWWTPRRWGTFLLALLCLGLLLAVPLTYQVEAGELRAMALVVRSRAFLVWAVPLALGVVWACSWLDPRAGEPMALFEGLSVWPSEAIRLLAAMLCAHYVVKAKYRIKKSDDDIGREFGLTQEEKPRRAIEDGAYWFSRLRQRSVWPGNWTLRNWDVAVDPPKRPRWSAVPLATFLRISVWRVLRGLRALFGPGRACEARSDVSPQKLWGCYRRSGTFRARFARTLILAVLYFGFACALIFTFEQPHPPTRGAAAYTVDMAVTMTSVAAFIFVVFFVVDGAYLQLRFLSYLSRGNTQWPDSAVLGHGGVVQDADAWRDYLDVRLIALRTKVIGDFVYYPFFILMLMVAARAPVFDHWDWPTGLVLVFAMNTGLALAGAVILRASAERARRAAIRELEAVVEGCTRDNKPKRAEVARRNIERIRNEREGAFSVLSQYPTLAAILLPGGSVGLWVLLDQIAKHVH